jgi:hypothetical protein
MLKEISQGALSNVAALVIVWLLLVAVLSAFVERRQLPHLGRAFLRLFRMIVTSPLAFAQKTVEEFCDRSQEEERTSLDSDQYLFRKLVLGLKGLMVLASFGLLAFGLVGAWKILPTNAQFKTVATLTNQIQENQQRLPSLEEELLGLEAAWRSSKRPQASWQVPQLEQQAKQAALRREALWNSIRGTARLSDLIATGQLALPAPEMPLNESQVASLRESKGSSLPATLSDEESDLIGTWLDAWAEQATVLGSLRSQEWNSRVRSQQGYREAFSAYSSTFNALLQQPKELEDLRLTILERRIGAIQAFLVTLAAFLGLLWLFGLTVEGLSLVIRLAGDVREILRRGSPPPAQEAFLPIGSFAGSPEASPDSWGRQPG